MSLLPEDIPSQEVPASALREISPRHDGLHATSTRLAFVDV